MQLPLRLDVDKLRNVPERLRARTHHLLVAAECGTDPKDYTRNLH